MIKYPLEKFYLFGIIPLLEKETYKDTTTWKILKFIPLITIISEGESRRQHCF